MNKEVLKKIKDSKKKHSIRKWWKKNSYIVWRILLFPLWLTGIIVEKVNKKLNDSIEWDEERATKILNYYVPKHSSWSEDDKTLYYFTNGYGWYRGIKRKDRRFWNKHRRKIEDFLINEFEIEGFEKIKGCCEYPWIELDFEMIEQKGDK